MTLFGNNICRTETAIYWQCTRRRRSNRCCATVIERNAAFWQALNVHNHPPVVDAEINTRVHANVRSAARAIFLESAPQMVQEALLGDLHSDHPLESMATVNSLERCI